MPTKFEKGDIFHTEGLRAYAHGCNCAGSMDAGVAVAFKKRWPRMFDAYQAHCASRKFHLGDVFTFSEGDEVVYCLAIQESETKKANLPALTKSLKTMAELAKEAGIERVGLPRIGTGHAGLDWPRVKKTLSEAGKEMSVTLVVFEQFVRRPGGIDADGH
jgi:O-acetyl-ADP-ribose deacetylase (regulator of RNase III)